MEEAGLDQVIRGGYDLLDMQTYFTAGVKALNKVDLPTLGRPTIPQLKPIMVSQYVNKISNL